MYDDAFDALANEHRRKLLVALLDENRRFGTGTVPRGETGGVERELGVRAELYHNHLPKLAERGYITWDEEAGEIERGPNWEEIEPLLELFCEHEAEFPGEFR